MIIGECKFCKKQFRKRERKYKFCSLICANRFNLNGLKQVRLPRQSKLLAEFIGICLGDGYVSSYQVGITLNNIVDKQYIQYVLSLGQKLFPGVTVSLVPKNQENAIDVRINSRVVADFLRDMGIVPNNKKIPTWIFEKEEYKKACVRGLFDTEGSISFRLYDGKTGKRVYKQLNFRNIDKKIMLFVRDILVDLRLKPTMKLKKSLYLSNHNSIDIFREKIGFGNPKLDRRSLIYTFEDYKFWIQSKL